MFYVVTKLERNKAKIATKKGEEIQLHTFGNIRLGMAKTKRQTKIFILRNGKPVASGKNEKEAIEKANLYLSKNGKDKILNEIRIFENKFGRLN